MNSFNFSTFWPLNSRIRWTKWQLAVARPNQRLSKNQIPAPQDSHSGYFSIKIRTYGCKRPSAKNEGMDERIGTSLTMNWHSLEIASRARLSSIATFLLNILFRSTSRLSPCNLRSSRKTARNWNEASPISPPPATIVIRRRKLGLSLFKPQHLPRLAIKTSYLPKNSGRALTELLI